MPRAKEHNYYVNFKSNTQHLNTWQVNPLTIGQELYLVFAQDTNYTKRTMEPWIVL